MALAPSLGSVEALFRKAEREAYRAFHAPRPLHQADHFFNFCITAHALRDYFFERKGLTNSRQTKPYKDSWDQEPIIVAVQEIANRSKHFQLRYRSGSLRPVSTGGVRQTRSGVMHIFMDDAGAIEAVPGVMSDMIVRLSDGQRYQLWEFTSHVLSYWRDLLARHGIKVRRQSFAVLAGMPGKPR